MRVPNRLDIVIPVYNERENFQTAYAAIRECVRSDWMIIMVYDRDDDTTLESARAIATQDARVSLVKNAGRGVLDAIRTGFASAQAEAVLVMMVDDPRSVIERFDEMLRRFFADDATIVVASRYMRGGRHTGGPVLKGLLSRLAGVSLHYAVGLPTHDATYATRMYRRSFLTTTRIESTAGFVLTIELTLKAYFEGKRIVEIPVHWHERTVGESRFNLQKWLPLYLHWYLWALRKRYGISSS